MKWIVRTILLIIIAFLGAMGAGYLTDPALNVQRSQIVDAESFDIFPIINDLRTFELWSPWRDLGRDGFVVAGPPGGEGQELAWRSEDPAIGTGSQVITESLEGSYVRSELNFSGRMAMATYALEPLDDYRTNVLIAIESDLGGFPYIQRLFKSNFANKTEAQFDRALNDLNKITQNTVAQN